ncbi:MAG: hypothetical protein U0800_07805 [Isosphaeraceae bacterium]
MRIGAGPGPDPPRPDPRLQADYNPRVVEAARPPGRAGRPLVVAPEGPAAGVELGIVQSVSCREILLGSSNWPACRFPPGPS